MRMLIDMKLFVTNTLIACALLAATGQGGTLSAQDEKKDEKPKVKNPPANLDPNNIDVTALWLNKALIRQRELQAEADRTGNFVKLNEYKKKLESDLEEWVDVPVKWLVQVESVGADNDSGKKTKVEIVTSYAYKNKSQLSISVKDDGRLGGLGLGGGSGWGSDVEYNEAWAKTLKRGDYIVLDGKIKSVSLSRGAGGLGINRMPFIYIQAISYSKYVPPKKK